MQLTKLISYTNRFLKQYKIDYKIACVILEQFYEGEYTENHVWNEITQTDIDYIKDNNLEDLTVAIYESGHLYRNIKIDLPIIVSDDNPFRWTKKDLKIGKRILKDIYTSEIKLQEVDELLEYLKGLQK